MKDHTNNDGQNHWRSDKLTKTYRLEHTKTSLDRIAKKEAALLGLKEYMAMLPHR